MRLLRARVQNYRAIDNLELVFADAMGAPRAITVLAGPNGCGKTSFLFAIANALRGVLGYSSDDVPAPSPDDIRSPGGEKSGWTPQPREVRVDIDLQFEQAEQDAIRELSKILPNEILSQKIPLPAIPGGQLKVSWKYPPGFDRDGTRLNWWNASVEPHLPGVRTYLRARTLAIKAWSNRVSGMRPDLLDGIGGLSFFPQDRNLHERVLGYHELSKAQGSEDRGSDVDAEEDDEQASVPRRRRQRSVAEILHYLSGYARGQLTPLPDERNWEKRIQDVFHQVCSPKRYLGYLYREDEPLGTPVFQDGDYQYPLPLAASGEQVILEYITRLTYPRPMQRSLILIDEPEVHLHPAWMRQLYLALTKLPGSNQFVMSTHSAELRKRAAADNALVDLGTLGSEG